MYVCKVLTNVIDKDVDYLQASSCPQQTCQIDIEWIIIYSLVWSCHIDLGVCLL